MDDPRFLFGVLLALIAPIGTWAVMREKTKRIDIIEPQISELKTEIAVLKSKQDDHGSRIEGFTSAIEAMEKRIVDQVRQLFEAFTRGQK